MTNEEFNIANELRRQIGRLTELLGEFKKVTIDDSPSRMTGFDICRSSGDRHTPLLIIENCELEFLIDAIAGRINVLEYKFDRL